MKKILLTAAAVATLSLNSTSALAAAESFYLKANVGGDKLMQTKHDELKFKSKNNVFFGAGVGYYVRDGFRAELTFDHYLKPEYKGTFSGQETDDDVIVQTTESGKIKANIDTLLLNGFVDLFDVGIAKVFVGAGVGMSRITAKLNVTSIEKSTFLGDTTTETKQFNYKIKNKNSFACAFHLGTSAEVSSGVNVELTYSFRNMGKFERKSDNNGPDFKGHHVAAGVRFDI